MLHVTRFVPPLKEMKYKTTNPNCKCGKPRRSGARNCKACHAEKQKAYRDDMKQKRQQITEGTYADAVLAFKREFIVNAMRAEGGNMCATARRIGVHRNSVTRILQDVGISLEEVKMFRKKLKKLHQSTRSAAA